MKHLGRKLFHLIGGIGLLFLYYVLGREQALFFYAVLFFLVLALEKWRAEEQLADGVRVVERPLDFPVSLDDEQAQLVAMGSLAELDDLLDARIGVARNQKRPMAHGLLG